MTTYTTDTVGLLDFYGQRIIAISNPLTWRERLRVLFGGQPRLRVYADDPDVFRWFGLEFPFSFDSNSRDIVKNAS